MTVQMVELLGGFGMVLVVAGLALLSIFCVDEPGEMGCFVWVVAWFLAVVAMGLFTAAGVK